MTANETKYVYEPEQWESWKEPSDKGNNRATLRRIVDEWQDQKQILADLATIHPNPNRALATLLHSHEVLSKATVTMQVAADLPTVALPEPTEADEFDFEDSVPC